MTYNFILFSSLITGKTLLAKTLARFVNVPFVIADATTLTQASAEPCITLKFKFHFRIALFEDAIFLLLLSYHKNILFLFSGF
jgi:hypothetical protein